MPDLLNALRRLYEEPGPEGIPPAGDEAEVRALAEVKAGLDALPKRRPDTATLDAVFAAAAAPAPLPDDDPPEAAALAEVKAGLDALPRRRPDASTLEAVLAAAAAPAAPPAAPAADRPARRRSSRRRAAGLGTAFALLLAVASVLWLVPDDEAAPPIAMNAPQEEATSAEPEADITDTPEPDEPEASPDEPVADALAAASPRSEQVPSAAAGRSSAVAERVASPPAAPPPAPSAAPVPTGHAAAGQAGGAGEEAADLQLAREPIPLADGEEALRLLYLRMLEMQAAQAGLGWDEPPTALGAAPDSLPATSGWMQVRVER